MLPSQRPYLTTLTPLRGIAALLVVIFHSNLMVMGFMPPGYTRLLDFGWLWVDFFFILSGFIMCYVYARDFEHAVTRGSYWKFIGARFARVYPLHLFTLLWASIMTAIVLSYARGLDPFFEEMFNLGAIPSSLVLLQGMHLYTAAPLNTPSWSLSTEWWMYMIFPFLVPYFTNTRVAWKIVMIVLIVAGYFGLKYGLGDGKGPFGYSINFVADWGFIRCFLGFAIGMLVYDLYKAGAGYALFKSSISFAVSFVGVLVAMHFGWDDMLTLAFFPFIILSAAYNGTQVKRMLDWRPLQRLGDWSFSIYMVHIPIAYFYTIWSIRQDPTLFADFMKLVTTPPDLALGWKLCIALVTLTLMVAALTYRYIEIPARNYLNKRFQTRRATLVVEEANA